MALKVVGAGLGRTGTLSLKLALEHVGFGPCYHMLEITSAPEVRFPQWMQVIQGSPDWDAIFDGFASTVDYPTANYWRELTDYYPDSKVILYTRDAEGWFDSVTRTIFSPDSLVKTSEAPLGEFFRQAVTRDFHDRIGDRAFMVDYYRRREEEVIASLPPERLLVHRLGDGWEPLCAFLGVPVPDEPYPVVNTTEDMSTMTAARKEDPAPDAVRNGAQVYIDAMRNKAFGG